MKLNMWVCFSLDFDFSFRYLLSSNCTGVSSAVFEMKIPLSENYSLLIASNPWKHQPRRVDWLNVEAKSATNRRRTMRLRQSANWKHSAQVSPTPHPHLLSLTAQWMAFPCTAEIDNALEAVPAPSCLTRLHVRAHSYFYMPQSDSQPANGKERGWGRRRTRRGRSSWVCRVRACWVLESSQLINRQLNGFFTDFVVCRPSVANILLFWQPTG